MFYNSLRFPYCLFIVFILGISACKNAPENTNPTPRPASAGAVPAPQIASTGTVPAPTTTSAESKPVSAPQITTKTSNSQQALTAPPAKPQLITYSCTCNPDATFGQEFIRISMTATNKEEAKEKIDQACKDRKPGHQNSYLLDCSF